MDGVDSESGFGGKMNPPAQALSLQDCMDHDGAMGWLNGLFHLWLGVLLLAKGLGFAESRFTGLRGLNRERLHQQQLHNARSSSPIEGTSATTESRVTTAVTVCALDHDKPPNEL